MIQNIEFRVMIPEDINSLSTQELCDLLSKKTMDLLELIGQKGTHNYNIIHTKEFEVKLIQSAIKQKKSLEKNTA